MPNTASKIFGDVRIVERVPTWRGHKYILSYLLLDHEPSVDELVAPCWPKRLWKPAI
jgi:hypothetical protein